MKAGIIFARKTTWRSRLDLEYLDETSARKVSSRQQQDDGKQRTTPLRQFVDYASKETLGQVHAGGFLHHLILINEDGSRTAPSRMTKRGTQEAYFGGVVRAHPKISDFLERSGHSAAAGFLDVARDARQARRCRNQSRPRVANDDEDDHGKV